MDTDFKEQTAIIDKVIAARKLPLSLSVYRGMNAPAGSIGKLTNKRNFGDRGFISTSRSSSEAANFIKNGEGEKILFRIKLPRGYTAAPLGGVEDEFLLPRGRRFIIVKVNRSGKVIKGKKIDAIIDLQPR